MIPYILMFIASLVFVGIGLKNKEKLAGKILVTIGLLLPCILAGLRDVSIGTDTGGYIHNLYQLSKSSNSLFDFFETAHRWYLQSDYIYLTITYLIGKSGLGFGVLLFIYECLIVFPIYLAMKKQKVDRRGTLIGLAIFYLLLYNVTLNMLRQSISIAFVVLAFSYYIESTNKKEKLFSYLIALMSYGFHSTAIFALAIIAMYKIYTSNNIKEKSKSFLSIIITVLSVAFVVFYKYVLTFIGTSGIYGLALYYLNRYSITDFSFYQTLINVLMLFIIVVNKKAIKKSRMPYKFLLAISIINLIISSGLGYFILYSQRIMLYIQYVVLLCFVPRIKYSNANGRNSLMIFMTILALSWLAYFALKNVGETVPYILSSAAI